MMTPHNLAFTRCLNENESEARVTLFVEFSVNFKGNALLYLGRIVGSCERKLRKNLAAYFLQ